MTTYYRGPTNDNFGYDPDLVTPTQLPFGSSDPWGEMEQLQWVDVCDLNEDDVIVESYYLDELHRGAEILACDDT